MQDAVLQGVFPGAVLFVRQGGLVRYHQAFGCSRLYPEPQPTSIETVYDLASLTKPLATATALLCLVQDQQVRLEDAIEDLLPALKGTMVGRAAVLHLLNHSAGLAAWRPFYEAIAERDRRQPGFLGSEDARCMVLKQIGREALVHPIGTKSLYSDLGYILLGMAVERITGRSLGIFCGERIYEPNGAFPLSFIMEAKDRTFAERTAATEHDPWRGRMLHAEVHDENAYALGGMAGHAGLFGTAGGVAAVTGLWLDSYVGRRSFLSPTLVRRFTSRQLGPSGSSWGLGWDTPSAPSSSGAHFSSQAFGHLGFTGTSIWIDPSCELEVVLLSNRVHPTRQNRAIQAFRPALHDVIYEHAVGRPERKRSANARKGRS